MPSQTSFNASVEEKLAQLQHLCVLLAAANEACKVRSDVKYASGTADADKSKSLPDFQRFLCKLAQICDTQKGGKTITGLVCLRSPQGAEYLISSNQRKDTELQQTTEYLSGLLNYIATNPEDLKPKPLQKQVLWRILERNFDRLVIYLRELSGALESCIADFSHGRGATDTFMVEQLRLLQRRASFPPDMTSTENARPKFLRDFETLIKAVQNTKNSRFDVEVEKRASDDGSSSMHVWCNLRHFLGRLHSYRQASEIIVATFLSSPDLFRNVQVNYIPSAPAKRTTLLGSTGDAVILSDLLQTAFPDRDLEALRADITELERYGLGQRVLEQFHHRKVKARIHAEVHLHNHLVQHGKTRPADYWNNIMFIASSKPVCRLCHYYFESSDNEFQVQQPHMNLYPKWRLPDLDDNADQAAMDRYEDVLEDIIEQMQRDTLNMFKEKVPKGKRNDSRTDSHVGSTAASRYFRGASSDGRSNGTTSGLSFGPSNAPFSAIGEEEEDGFIDVPHFIGSAK